MPPVRHCERSEAIHKPIIALYRDVGIREYVSWIATGLRPSP